MMSNPGLEQRSLGRAAHEGCVGARFQPHTSGRRAFVTGATAALITAKLMKPSRVCVLVAQSLRGTRAGLARLMRWVAPMRTSTLPANVVPYERWFSRRHDAPAGGSALRLWVLACLDDRLLLDDALGSRADAPAGGIDAHCYRNPGGVATDDALRSAMLSCHYFGTKEIVILQHTQCGASSSERGLGDADVICQRTVEVFRSHPFIPQEVTVSGWIWEIETRHLRPPRLERAAASADASLGREHRW